MRAVIRKIDRALKRLYNLDSSLNAEDFLVSRSSMPLEGALLVREPVPRQLSVAIYLNQSIQNTLIRFPRGPCVSWSRRTLSAFTVASEEVSHFHYLMHHAEEGRSVTRLELELQGEIDKFLLTFFANHDRRTDCFEPLFEKMFERFRLAETLSEQERERYLEANRMAKKFLRQFASSLGDPKATEEILKELRRFYRLSAVDKISIIA